MIHILYNPLANSGQGEIFANEAAKSQRGETVIKSLVDLDVKAYLSTLGNEDKVIICGGDGTLNRFANDTYGMNYPCEIYIYKSGTGNDFLRDLEDKVKDNMLLINDYLKNLPVVIVNGETHRFVNGIGYGIDGMVCEVADRLAAKGKKANYTLLSIKLLIHGYKCPDAKITVDGKAYEFKKVWLASGMNGRYYGGGMKIAPTQDRLDGVLTSSIVYASSKLRTLMLLLDVFKGEHVKHEKYTKLIRGNEITVEFNIPTALQIDGETVLGVSSYTIKK